MERAAACSNEINVYNVPLNEMAESICKIDEEFESCG